MMGRCQRLDPSSILGRRMCYEIPSHKGIPLCHLGFVPDKVKLSITFFIIVRFFFVPSDP